MSDGAPLGQSDPPLRKDFHYGRSSVNSSSELRPRKCHWCYRSRETVCYVKNYGNYEHALLWHSHGKAKSTKKTASRSRGRSTASNKADISLHLILDKYSGEPVVLVYEEHYLKTLKKLSIVVPTGLQTIPKPITNDLTTKVPRAKPQKQKSTLRTNDKTGSLQKCCRNANVQRFRRRTI